MLEELGKNIAIVWGGRTTMQAGGERAGRRVFLTVDDARAIEREAPLVAVVSAEINRGLRIKSAYNAASLSVHGIEPQYQAIRTIDIEHGRSFAGRGRTSRLAASPSSAPTRGRSCSASGRGCNETVELNGVPYTVIGKIRKKNQDSNYSGPDNNKVFVPFAAMSRDFPRLDAARRHGLGAHRRRHGPASSRDLPRVLDARTGRIQDIDWPLERNVRHVLARRKGFDPEDRDAMSVWDTSLETPDVRPDGRHMKQFFTIVGFITLALGGLGVMNIMLVAVRERTREIGVRKALGATTAEVQRQFFLEGFFLTMLSGAAGIAVALGLCSWSTCCRCRRASRAWCCRGSRARWRSRRWC